LSAELSDLICVHGGEDLCCGRVGYDTIYCSLVGGYYITCLINDFSLSTKPRDQVPMTIS
jgi:hypothetical protein